MQADCCCQGLMLNVFDEAALTTETRQTVILAKCVCVSVCGIQVCLSSMYCINV